MATQPDIKLVNRQQELRASSGSSAKASAGSSKNRVIIIVLLVLVVATLLSYIFLWPSGAKSDKPQDLQEGQHAPSRFEMPGGQK